LVENQRIRESLEKFGMRFRNRVFTVDEQAYCEKFPDPVPHYAARFAAKEAVSKAFGTGIGGQLGWLDIEIYKRDGSGEPFVRMLGKGHDLLQARHAGAVLVSLTHTKEYAAAQAVVVAG
jgi:holo-[acyl-carrier protein] synthase